MKIRFGHVNLISSSWRSLADFYIKVFAHGFKNDFLKRVQRLKNNKSYTEAEINYFMSFCSHTKTAKGCDEYA